MCHHAIIVNCPCGLLLPLLPSRSLSLHIPGEKCLWERAPLFLHLSWSGDLEAHGDFDFGQEVVAMRAAPGIISLFLLGLTLALSGCQGNPFLTAQRGAAWQQQQEQQPPYVAQMQDLNRRNSDLDSNNRDLHSQFAQSQQRSQVLSDEVALLRKQLSDTVDKLKTEQTARQDVDNRLSALQASTQFRGGATLKANNSIKESLRLVDVPGLEVRQDGDVIRIELPVDRLFQPGTAQLIPTGTPLLDQVADSITRNYRRQRIGIEGHSDNLAVSPNMRSSHQLTAAQAIAIFDQLISRNRMPANQLFTMAHGPNHPRFSNGDAAGRARNRRIELVIYPETVE